MILLIQDICDDPERLKENLNSIMILLIPSLSVGLDNVNTGFKFHYDSINSAMSVSANPLDMNLI